MLVIGNKQIYLLLVLVVVRVMVLVVAAVIVVVLVVEQPLVSATYTTVETSQFTAQKRMERDPRILFHETPTINPETGKSIQIGKATYNRLVQRYGAPPEVVVPPQDAKPATTMKAAKKLCLARRPSPSSPPKPATITGMVDVDALLLTHG